MIEVVIIYINKVENDLDYGISSLCRRDVRREMKKFVGTERSEIYKTTYRLYDYWLIGYN